MLSKSLEYHFKENISPISYCWDYQLVRVEPLGGVSWHVCGSLFGTDSLLRSLSFVKLFFTQGSSRIKLNPVKHFLTLKTMSNMKGDYIFLLFSQPAVKFVWVVITEPLLNRIGLLLHTEKQDFACIKYLVSCESGGSTATCVMKVSNLKRKYWH